MSSIASSVQDYYGKVLDKSEDLKTNACKTFSSPPPTVSSIISVIHDEVVSKYYGCGLCIPKDFSLLKGLRVLDLGCGAGRDCYILSKLVGETGYVVGVDMTDEQLEVARRHVEFHTNKFGYAKPNVEFKKGYIEKLSELGFEEGSFDLIVSNCVINLSADKPAVLREAHRILKTGGELYFSDVYSDRRIPTDLKEDKMLWGECLSGALYWNDFSNLAKQAGFKDPRLLEDSRITISNSKVEKLIGHINFFSAVYRLFKLNELEPACEDYGQAVIYNGNIPEMRNSFILDNHHEIETGRVFPVCGNTLAMLKETRFSPYFTVLGDGKMHYGIFDGCGTSLPFESGKGSGEATAGATESCC